MKRIKSQKNWMRNWKDWKTTCGESHLNKQACRQTCICVRKGAITSTSMCKAKRPQYWRNLHKQHTKAHLLLPRWQPSHSQDCFEEKFINTNLSPVIVSACTVVSRLTLCHCTTEDSWPMTIKLCDLGSITTGAAFHLLKVSQLQVAETTFKLA